MIPLQATPAGNAPEIAVPSVDWLAISPLIALMAGALLIILLRPWCGGARTCTSRPSCSRSWRW